MVTASSLSVNEALLFLIIASIQNRTFFSIYYCCAKPNNTHKVENLFPHFPTMLTPTSPESSQTSHCSHDCNWVSAHCLCYQLFNANVCEMWWLGICITMCLIECFNETVCLGTPWFLDMWDVGRWGLNSQFLTRCLRGMWCHRILWFQGICRTMIIVKLLVFSLKCRKPR